MSGQPKKFTKPDWRRWLACSAVCSMALLVALAAIAGGRVNVTKSDTPDHPGGGGGAKIFVGESIGLEAEYIDTSGDDETGAGGWRWWVDDATPGSYNSDNDADSGYSFSSSEPGSYTVNAQKNNGKNEPKDSISVEVIEGSIKLEANEDEISVFDDKKVKLTASISDNPEGDVTFSFYANSSFIGSETTGGKSASLEYPGTLPASPAKIRFHVTVDHSGFPEPAGGDGDPAGDPEENEVDVRFFAATLIIWADQPGSGGDRNAVEDESVGHAFWTISLEGGDDLLDEEQSLFNGGTFGYYPVNWSENIDAKGKDWEAPGQLGDDSGHNWDARKVYELESPDQAISVIDYTIGLYDSPGTYLLDENNCADAAIGAGQAAGVGVPDTLGSAYGGLWQGSNPGDLGEDLVAAGGERNEDSGDDDGTSGK